MSTALARVIGQVSVDDLVVTSTIETWDVVLAIVVLVASWLLSRYARRSVVRLSGRLEGVSNDLRQLVGRLTGYFVLLIGIGITLTILGAPIQPLLSAAIIVAVVVGLALRGVADNFAAGVVIQTRRPVRVDDEIDCLDHTGTVLELNSRSVVIETVDGHIVHLPNAKVLDSPIVNHTAAHRRRSAAEVRVTTGVGTPVPDDLAATIRDVVAAVSGVFSVPPPIVVATAAETGRLTLVVRFWHGPADAASVSSAVVLALSERLSGEGLTATVTSPPPPPPVTPPPSV